MHLRGTRSAWAAESRVAMTTSPMREQRADRRRYFRVRMTSAWRAELPGLQLKGAFVAGLSRRRRGELEQKDDLSCIDAAVKFVPLDSCA